MSSKKEYQKMLDALMAQINAQNQKINTPSPWENQMGAEANSITDFLNSRDYRNLPAGVNIDLMPLADAQKMRQMTRGSMNTGQGAINPQILAQQRELDDNQFAQDWGNAFENKVGELGNRRDALLGGLQQQYNTRIGQGQQNLGNYFGSMQALLNRPKGFWSQFASYAIPAGMHVAGSLI